MTVRLNNIDNTPLRVVVDGKNQITNTHLNIFSEDANTQVFNSENTKINDTGKLDLNDILSQLATQDINSVLLEAGPSLIGAMVTASIVNIIKSHRH
jgi:diaminohydroxyphosphoribosylaminopyrimidine deaminase/5-amino-6-(5-phosphoribosylamino)uracil reductase